MTFAKKRALQGIFLCQKGDSSTLESEIARFFEEEYVH
jgi:hypothetical protein